MRCLACDRKLNDYESTRRYASSGDFVDLCNRCFSEIADDVPDIEGDGFDHDEDYDIDAGYEPDWEGDPYSEPQSDE